ncbi:5-hydroxytryptamine receptor 3A [Bagarius yarrelli]|uniref:5-hydroxytryptamine receptor 3A n=1 Tax=Bagarius yarrelli TaxID=175774 RepID=A0A556TVZ7_BAGYA|nr:5-hydroxytryptamine receptor 3A [Bagarius yarrelli]
MQFSSRIKITMEWIDPDLGWSGTNYTFNEILLPVKKIWTPDLVVENAIYVNVKPVTDDVVVKNDGTVNYAIVMYITVLCRINLLTYPFVKGSCPVAINGWNQSSCGMQIQYGSISAQIGDGSEWSTVSVNLRKESNEKNHNYIYVTMSSNPFKAMVSLVLPSALIMIADLVSFFLPLDGGKRSSFKITLVLSFTMFILILTDNIPNSGSCSPLIRYHFCFCMFVLVLSMLISMVFTKVATDGNILCCKLPKLDQTGTQFFDMIADGPSLRKIVHFVEKMDKKESSIKTKQMLAAKLDKICLWAYEWNDPDLAWSEKEYNFSEIMLPVDTIWTPDLTVDNAVKTEVMPVSTDILVRRDGSVQHAIQLYTTVVCGINLFNYPFVKDECPVALNGWKDKGCGLRFIYGSVSPVGSSRGEWLTLAVALYQNKQNLDRNYLSVTMSINPFNTIVTLILPSVLIMLADLGSFALPLDGGKRSSFKITLVLSFTMSLLILTEHLPDTGLCSPMIRYHFCFCLIVLVLSLLTSMMSSRIAETGTIFPCGCSKKPEFHHIYSKDETKKACNVSATPCLSRRCLANDIINEKLYSAPQPSDCFIDVNLTAIQYETLSFKWKDPELTWTESNYSFTEVLLPYNNVWLPNLTVNNAIHTAVQPLFNDILVKSDGVVNYAVHMYITVVCDMNLFTYPFVKDTCLVAINGWNRSSCGVKLNYGKIKTQGGREGEWQTLDVELRGEDPSYLEVTLHLNPFNAMVSLVLPTALIMVVDLVSFTLPLDGERNAFKIKLVFSFAMFLLILSKQLPQGGACSPLIYYHFCFCLIVLVLSLLVSMILSQLARTGSIWPGKLQKQKGLGSSMTQHDDVPHQNGEKLTSFKTW